MLARYYADRQLCLFPTLMLSRKCTGQFFQVLPGAGGGEGCAPGLPPGQPGCGATLGMERDKDPNWFSEGIWLT